MQGAGGVGKLHGEQQERHGRHRRVGGASSASKGHEHSTAGTARQAQHGRRSDGNNTREPNRCPGRDPRPQSPRTDLPLQAASDRLTARDAAFSSAK